MAFIVKLKRGPMDSLKEYPLEKYEIGFCTTDNKAYIGTGDGKFIPLTDCEKVNKLLKNVAIDNNKIKMIEDV